MAERATRDRMVLGSNPTWIQFGFASKVALLFLLFASYSLVLSAHITSTVKTVIIKLLDDLDRSAMGPSPLIRGDHIEKLSCTKLERHNHSKTKQVVVQWLVILRHLVYPKN